MTADIDKGAVSVLQPPLAVNRELRDLLAVVPGVKVREAVPLASVTTLRIGGPADLFVRVESEAALLAVMTLVRECASALHLHGHGSNVLFPDRGIRGVVCRLRGELESVEVEGETVRSGAGVTLARLARDTSKQGLLGLEALSGFPSTVGGAVVMNAGCYGTEIRDVLTEVRVARPGRPVETVPVLRLEPGYRTTNLQGTDAVVTRAEFQLRSGDGAAALRRIDELNRRRWRSLPSGKPNAGSVFRNPQDDFAGRLIEACGLKGLRRGGAEISQRHANVIVNREKAGSADVLELMVAAHRAVRDRFGVELRPEIVLAGDLAEEFWERARSG
ncbi:MAG: UDP-N-acetylmuramate dehydrogenase [Acidobacteria bacterium]|nr:UDP-N-acetylmuramate dehydrogenase [Acidobacteriota bacterium]MCY3966040.1 UDP-N-acetylmuramate dehydrogenase [Acidobacteriota bacterium]